MAGSLDAQSSERLFDFSGEAGSGRWVPVNDGVMGGVSSGEFRQDPRGFATFQGFLSLENNGGFASVRGVIDPGTLSGSTTLVLRVRGDGKRYQLRLRMGGEFDGVAYVTDFDTVRDEWTTVSVPLESLEPSFRGYRPRSAPPLDLGEVRQIGLMLTDKQEGPFRLDIEWIDAASEGTSGAG